ncbi:hypothetical protein Angca_000305, partial [Angiostrongylus cantonensis]
SLTWVLSDCKKSQDAGFIIEWEESGVDVILGPGCSPCKKFHSLTLMRDNHFVAAVISGIVAKSLHIPVVVWVTSLSSTLLNTIDYPTLMSPTFSSIKFVR